MSVSSSADTIRSGPSRRRRRSGGSRHRPEPGSSVLIGASEVAFLLLLLEGADAVVVGDAVLTFGGGGEQQLTDDVGERGRIRFDGAGDRIAAERAEAHEALLRLLARLEAESIVVDHDQRTVAFDDRPLLGEVQRHERDVLDVDVLPEVEFRPVRQGEHADALAGAAAAVVERPQLGALTLGIPLVLW